MLFITNRVLKEGPTPIDSEGNAIVPRQVNFDLKNNQAEQSVYFCRRNAPGNYTEIGGRNFLNELKNANVRQLLLYLHGYSSLPEPAIFPRTQELQRLSDQLSPRGVLVVPIIWPCDNDLGAVKDYFDDQIAADASTFAYARLFEMFIKWRGENSTIEDPCTKQINILAHSMGARVLRGTLARTVQYYQQGGIPFLFRNIFLASADIVNEALEPGQEGEFIPQSSRNVVVYFAADDLALRASKVANVGNAVATRRLGHTGPERMDQVPRNVYALDCSDFNNDYDSPAGHGYFASAPQGGPGLLFSHLWRCIETGRVPMNPPNARVTILNAQSRLVEPPPTVQGP